MLSRIIKALKLRFTQPYSWSYYKTILLYDHANDVTSKGKGIYLQRFNLLLQPGQGMPLLENYRIALQLAENIGAAFTYTDSVLSVSFGRYNFQIQTAEDIFILNEVYAEGTYNFLPAERDGSLVVVDIGMNVGFASVFFATHKNVNRVYSYEPFTPTYRQAQKHLEMNNVTQKVSAANFGLGGSDEVLEVDYTPEFRGQVGIHGTGLILSEVKETVKEKISIHKITTEVEKIMNENEGAAFVFKIDCEGAEYGIMENLPASVFSNTKLMMIEWHEKGPQLLQKKLQEHGFACFSFNANSKKVGMIYAAKA